MKTREAIDQIVFYKNVLELNPVFDEALGHGIEALLKQVPKYPIWEDNGYSDEEYDTWYCPSCDTRYVDEEHKFCPKCGQAIKWGDEDGTG